MTRTIEIVHINNIGYKQPHVSNKSYLFLCEYDEVNVGDIITDSRYSTPMEVIGITNSTSVVQNNHLLKYIKIDTINGREINKPNNNTRTLSITIEQAREWYESGNETLKTLALNVYTKKELELDYKFIAPRVTRKYYTLCLPVEEEAKFSTMAKLAIIAKYYNGTWKRTTENTGYFIGDYNKCDRPINTITGNICIFKHSSVVYPGIIYFRTEEDAIKAVKILGDEVKNLF